MATKLSVAGIRRTYACPAGRPRGTTWATQGQKMRTRIKTRSSDRDSTLKRHPVEPDVPVGGRRTRLSVFRFGTWRRQRYRGTCKNVRDFRRAALERGLFFFFFFCLLAPRGGCESRALSFGSPQTGTLQSGHEGDSLCFVGPVEFVLEERRRIRASWPH